MKVFKCLLTSGLTLFSLFVLLATLGFSVNANITKTTKKDSVGNLISNHQLTEFSYSFNNLKD